MERQACRAASDQSACKVAGGAMDGRGLPRPWTEGMSWGATPTGGLLPGQGALSRQGGGGGVGVVPRRPRHKLPEGS